MLFLRVFKRMRGIVTFAMSRCALPKSPPPPATPPTSKKDEVGTKLGTKLVNSARFADVFLYEVVD
jgi:hypothetical protein